MILKTIRWKIGAFERLVDYIGRSTGEEGSFILEHNLRPSGDLSSIANQFRENDAYRKKRTRGVVLYHEILSFHAGDREHLTPDVLEDLTRKYLSIRAPEGLAFAMPHYDKGHIHVHIMLSGVQFKSEKTLRMDNPTFTRVRRQIEAFQIDRYPELKHSIVHLPKRVRSKTLQQEIETERPVIEQAYDEAQSMPDFLDRVSDLGVDQSKYQRLESGQLDFQIDTSRLEELDDRMRQLAELERKKRGRELDLGDDIERER